MEVKNHSQFPYTQKCMEEKKHAQFSYIQKCMEEKNNAQFPHIQKCMEEKNHAQFPYIQKNEWREKKSCPISEYTEMYSGKKIMFNFRIYRNV